MSSRSTYIIISLKYIIFLTRNEKVSFFLVCDFLYTLSYASVYLVNDKKCLFSDFDVKELESNSC